MEKKLPKMFVNKVDRAVGNNDKVFYSFKTDEERSVESTTTKNINQKIRDIFSSSNYVYKADVELNLNGKVVNKRIVGRNSTHLITIDNELIPITDIRDIKRN